MTAKFSTYPVTVCTVRWSAERRPAPQVSCTVAGRGKGAVGSGRVTSAKVDRKERERGHMTVTKVSQERLRMREFSEGLVPDEDGCAGEAGPVRGHNRCWHNNHGPNAVSAGLVYKVLYEWFRWKRKDHLSMSLAAVRACGAVPVRD